MEKIILNRDCKIDVCIDTPASDLFVIYYNLANLKDNISENFLQRALNGEKLNTDIYHIILDNLLNFSMEKKIDFIKHLICCEKANSLPKLCCVNDNKQIIIHYFEKLINDFIENNHINELYDSYDILKDSFKIFYNFCSEYKPDRHDIEQADENIKKWKKIIGDEYCENLCEIFESEDNEYDYEDFLNMCDTVLEFSPENIEALKIQNIILKNMRDEE